MTQLHIQCPHCRVQHPVQALPPRGTALRCNSCGNAFMTVQGPIPQQQQQQQFGQQPYGYAAPQAAQPMMPRRPVEPRKPQGEGLQPWHFVAIGVGSVAALIVVMVVVLVAFNSAQSNTTPPVAGSPSGLPTTPSVPSLPAASPTTPAPVTATPLGSNPYGSTPPTPTLPGGTTSQTTAVSPTPLSAPVTSSTSSGLIARLKPVETKPQYFYTWSPAEKYRYGFEVKTNGQQGPGGKVGVVEYEVSPLPGGEGDGGKQKASGTAFVVHSGGLLVTCQHVVGGASAINVHLNGKVYPAEVVAVDKPNDLAVLRIAASGLFALPLGDSDSVQLAEDVKAFGYPLSTVLGQSIKVTSGTIAGRVTDDSGSRLQVDISINPGNSGGPLVNRMGHVVGINSAGLFGGNIQEVSFAVPSNLAKKLVGTLNVPLEPHNLNTPLEGTRLAAMATTATAFVEVELGSASAVVLQFTGSSRSSGSNLSPPQRITSRVAAGLNGELLGSQEDMTLGLGLGTFGSMVFETLPNDGQTTWEQREVQPLSMAGTSRGAQQSISLLLERKTNYQLKSVDADKIVIGKKITVSTVGNSSLGTVKVTGDGTWTFDRKAGVPQKMEMTVDSYISLAGKTDTYNGTTRYERLDDASPSQWQQKIERELQGIGQIASGESSTLPKIELPKLSLEEGSDTEVSALLRQLRTKKKNSSRERFDALEKLARIKPLPKKQEEVANTLHAVRLDFPPGQQAYWIRAARVWGTSKNVPTLLFMLDAAASPSSERMLAMEAVSRMPPTKESAESIAKWLGDRTLGPVALQSLVVMGSASEEPAMNLLRRRTPARVLAALVLAHIGTEKSVTALEDFLRSEEDPEYRQLAKVALDEVRKRQSTGGKSQ